LRCSANPSASCRRCSAPRPGRGPCRPVRMS
jgi:hypothetical protein